MHSPQKILNLKGFSTQNCGNLKRKNTPCISDLAGVKFLLKKETVFFFREYLADGV